MEEIKETTQTWDIDTFTRFHVSSDTDIRQQSTEDYERFFVTLGIQVGERSNFTMYLSPTEARQLAAALIKHADRYEEKGEQ